MTKRNKIIITIVSIVVVGAIIALLTLTKPGKKIAYDAYNVMTTPFKYFTYSEFDSPDAPGSGQKFMNKQFIEKLDIARGKAGVPFKINSGYRTQAHNDSLEGSVPNSAHTFGLAADISAPTEEIKKKIALALYQSGFVRIGFANTFIHVDDDKTKPQHAFNYGTAHIYTLEELIG